MRSRNLIFLVFYVLIPTVENTAEGNVVELSAEHRKEFNAFCGCLRLKIDTVKDTAVSSMLHGFLQDVCGPQDIYSDYSGCYLEGCVEVVLCFYKTEEIIKHLRGCVESSFLRDPLDPEYNCTRKARTTEKSTK